MVKLKYAICVWKAITSGETVLTTNVKFAMSKGTGKLIAQRSDALNAKNV